MILKTFTWFFISSCAVFGLPHKIGDIEVPYTELLNRNRPNLNKNAKLHFNIEAYRKEQAKKYQKLSQEDDLKQRTRMILGEMEKGNIRYISPEDMRALLRFTENVAVIKSIASNWRTHSEETKSEAWKSYKKELSSFINRTHLVHKESIQETSGYIEIKD